MTHQRRGKSQRQGINERIRYAFNAVPIPVAAGTATAWDETLGRENAVDVSGAVFEGAGIVQNNTLYFPWVFNLQEDHIYRIEIQYLDADGNTFEPYFYVKGER